MLDVSGRGDVDGAVYIIPDERKATIFCARPIFTHGVLFLECSHEVLGIGEVCVFDTEVVDNEREHNVVLGVFPEPGGDGYRCPCGARKAVSLSLAILPASGRPYIPLRIST